jgi:hypothetical protein
VERYTGLTDFWIPLTAFIVGTILFSNSKAVKTEDGEAVYEMDFIKRRKRNRITFY